MIPAQTILIQNPAAVTVKSTNPAAAKAFLDFVYTPTAQKIFADNGYRPVVPGVVPRRQVQDPGPAVHHRRPRRVDGGHQAKFFDPTSGIVTKIEQSNGVSTSSK